MILQMYMADAEEKKLIKAENERIYQKAVESQNEHPDEIFSLRAIIGAVKGWEFSQSSIFYSYGNFWDFFTIVLCLICGIYTTGLFI